MSFDRMMQLRDEIESGETRLAAVSAELADLIIGIEDKDKTDGQKQRQANLEAGQERAVRELADKREEYRKLAMAYAERHGDGCLEPGDDRNQAKSPYWGGGGRRGGRRETSGARRVIERQHREGFLPDRAAERADRLVQVDKTPLTAGYFEALGDPDYRSAFDKMVKDPQFGHRMLDSRELRAWQKAQEQRTIIGGTDSLGGFLVPTHLDPAVILSNDGVLNPLREFSRVITLVVGDTWNGVSSAGVDASYAAELTEVGDDSPTFAGPSIPVHKAHAFVAASMEAVDDTANLASEVARMFGDARDRLEAEKFTVGTSADIEPTGFITTLQDTAASQVQVTTQGEFSAEDVYALSEALPPRWRARARYAGDTTVLNQVARLEDDTDRSFPEIRESPASLIRRPVAEISDMPAFVQQSTTTNSLLAYGDFTQLALVDRVGMSVEFIPHLFGETNQRPIGARGWYARWRSGSSLLLPNAMRLLIDHSGT